MYKEIPEILKKLHIEKLSQMQLDAIDAAQNSNRDLIILAPTGSGKTLAYQLPLAGMTWDKKGDAALDAVVIVPSRELAIQSNEVFRSLGTNLRSMALYGGRPTMDEHRELKNVNPHVVFATPGRLNDHIDKGNIDPLDVRHLVIDEFDKCLQMGFQNEMRKAMNSMSRVDRTFLLSATDCPEIPSFVRVARYERINYLNDADQTPSRIKLFTVHSETKDKLQTLSRMLHDFGTEQSIVFLNHRDGVERTAKYISDEGFIVSVYHGGLDQRQREEAIYRFANNSANVLVCTDLAARGLDIPGVKNIIHYNLPIGEEEYIHRIGRTARWDAEGNSFIILGPEEHLPEYVHEETAEYNLPRYTDDTPLPEMATLYIGKGKKDKISKGDIVGFLCKVGGLTGDQIGRIDVYDRYSYAAVARYMAYHMLKDVKDTKIKGVRTIVESAFEKQIMF